ncbi:MAG: metallophosphoesterase [Candidatus Odinarchaeota archaeon]
MDQINPKLLVVSDIHLGSLDSERELFIQFLTGIANGDYGNELQGLIILGDFIDLCTDIPKTLLAREKIQEILSLLLEIKNKMNLLFVLGNHEIPVTGDYDEKFEYRKVKFLIRFENSDFKEIFDERIFGQYLILKRWNNEDMLLLYNTRNQIETKPIHKVKLEGLDIDSNYGCFMTHGYQFDSEMYRFFIGQVWKSLIANNKFEVKETYDYFWNQVIKNGRKIKPISFENMKYELAQLKNKSLEYVDTLFSELTYLEFNLIKANMRILRRWHKASKPDYYFDEIKAFFEDKDFNFPSINHVIYGHTHHCGLAYGHINNQRVEIINDGAWQHIPPSYVEILSKGELHLRSFSNIVK